MIQLTLKEVEIAELQTRVKTVTEAFERTCREIARATNRHDLSAAVDKSYSYVSDILNTNQDGKPFTLYLLIATCLLNKDLFRDSILKFLNELADCYPPKKIRPMTAEDELRLLKRKIKEHGLEPIFENLEQK